MTKFELITRVARATGKPQSTVEAILDETLAQISAALVDDDSLMLRNFGTFETRHRADRTARNPRTDEQILVPATRIVKFRPSASLKGRVAGK